MQTRKNAQKNQTAGVTPQSAWRVKSISVLEGWRLHVTFLDGLEGEIKMSERIARKETGVFNALKDPAVFSQVYLDKGIVTWPGEIDLAPDAMYDAIKKHGEWVLR